MTTFALQIDPRDLRIDIFSDSGAMVKNKLGIKTIRITHLPSGEVTECGDTCSRHPNISAWNIDRKKCAISQLKQKLNDSIKAKQSGAGNGRS
jgi:protein subunit release factor A